MEKFLTMDFLYVLLWALLLLVVHEGGHYLAYRAFGIPARLRRSFFVPGIDPKEDISVKRWKGMVIACGGFLLSCIVINFPLYLFGYKHWFVLFLGSVAGSVVDFTWAFSMMGCEVITLHARRR